MWQCCHIFTTWRLHRGFAVKLEHLEAVREEEMPQTTRSNTATPIRQTILQHFLLSIHLLNNTAGFLTWAFWIPASVLHEPKPDCGSLLQDEEQGSCSWRQSSVQTIRMARFACRTCPVSKEQWARARLPGVTDEFIAYAREQKGWVSMRFGTESAFNPTTNKVLLETQGKRMIKQTKQNKDPERGGMQIHIYVLSQKQDLELQARLVHIYEACRSHRNEREKPQAYMTVFDPLALPHLTMYLYTSDRTGRLNGLAALRRIRCGYHVDPYCALLDAPIGISGLFIRFALAVLEKNYIG